MMFTFVLQLGRSTYQKAEIDTDVADLQSWFAEHNDVGIEVVTGMSSGFATFQDYQKNKAMMFKLTFAHLITADEFKE